MNKQETKKRKQPKKLRNTEGAVLPSRDAQKIAEYRAECAEYCVSQVEYLNREIARVKKLVMGKIDSFLDYAGLNGASNVRSRKGGFSLDTSDGLKRIRVVATDVFVVNEQLQVAKRLIDECIEEWTQVDPHHPLSMLAEITFQTNAQGNVSVTQLKKIRAKSAKVTDQRWQQAMQCIDEAIQVAAVKTYYGFLKRESVEDEFKSVDLNFSSISVEDKQ